MSFFVSNHLRLTGSYALCSVLKKAGIKQVVDLPGVGSNLSDQPGTGASALVVGDIMGNSSLIDGRNLFAPFITLPNLVQLFGTSEFSSVATCCSPAHRHSQMLRLHSSGR